MESSYRHGNTTATTTWPDGTFLTDSPYRPAIAGKYALGYSIEDFEFVSGLGDLDEHNGRTCVTPDYPSGIYAYFVTIDSTFTATYPYTLGLAYYGIVQAGNTGPGSGHNVPTGNLTTYTPTGITETKNDILFDVFPNPAADYFFIHVAVNQPNNLSATVFNSLGEKISEMNYLQPSITYAVDITHLENGFYFIQLRSEKTTAVKKMIVK